MCPLTEMYPNVLKCFLFGKIPYLRGLMLARDYIVNHEHKSGYLKMTSILKSNESHLSNINIL